MPYNLFKTLATKKLCKLLNLVQYKNLKNYWVNTLVRNIIKLTSSKWKKKIRIQEIMLGISMVDTHSMFQVFFFVSALLVVHSTKWWNCWPHFFTFGTNVHFCNSLKVRLSKKSINTYPVWFFSSGKVKGTNTSPNVPCN